MVHESADGSERTLATDAEVARSWWSKGRGLVGKTTVPEDYGLVFPFDSATPRLIHMVGVRTVIDVVWLVDGRVERVATLPAWWGVGRARADTVCELPPGAANGLEVGDRVRIGE